MSYDIIFPDRNGITGNETIKTRLGVRIEELTQNSITVHRISAQKALNIPDYAEIKNIEQAENELLFGRSDEHANIDNKMNTRWGRKPATFLLDDYSRLLSLLFSFSS